jgi:hypothetical protein
VAAASTPARRAVSDLLDEAAKDAWSKTKGAGTPDEVTFLRSLFHVAVRQLDSVLGPSLAAFGWSSETRGIFVHGRPFVAFDAARSQGGCELGDLLIVLHNARGPRPAGNALLLQGKRGALPLSLSGNEKKQWELYHDWPEFWWRHAFAYRYLGGDGRRHVEPPKSHRGAQYLSIEPKPPSGASFKVAQTGRNYRVDAEPGAFADAIVDTVLRYCGRRFSDQRTAHGRIGWDRVIWDLLESWAYSSPRMRARYQGFDAYRVGKTPPAILSRALLSPGVDATQIWSGLPELAGVADAGPPGRETAEEADAEEPPLISTIFIELSPIRGD